MNPPEEKKKRLDLSLLRRVFHFAAPYRSRFYGSLLLGIALAAIAPVRPWLIQITLNSGLQPDAHFGFLKGAASVITGITVIQIGLLLLESAARFVFSFFTASLGQHVVKDMRVAAFRHISHLELRQFDRTPIGTLTTRTINDIESINDIFSDGLIPILADLLSIIAVLAFMFFTDWKLTLVCLAPFPLLILATYYFKESVNRSFLRVRNAVAALNAFVQEHITGMAIVQGFAAEAHELEKFKRINEEHRSAHIKSIMAYSVFFPVVELVLAFSLGLLVWWAGGKSQTDAAGNITSFILCLNLLFRPLRVIADKFNVLQMGMIAGERVFKVLDNTDSVPNEGTLQPELFRGDIRFENVHFSYEPGRPVLQGIGFSLPAGQTLALVGNTGSGKTSIISLMNRLYPYESGQIYMDDHRVEEYELHYLRSKIAVVLQDVFLFSGSILDNVTLRNPEISRDQVESAAKLMGLHDFILRLPGGYDYQVKERGATLSLGQRQLLSFVRALLYNPSVLILDEATSSVDTESEQLIQRAIDTLIKGRTAIIIAHRLSTIRKAHQILVLEQGRVIESGTHQQLLAAGGHYSRLHDLQFESV